VKIGLILLAAGRSERLGRPKQLLLFRGRPLLRHCCEVAIGAECFDRIVVVLGAFADEIRGATGKLPATVVVNRRWRAGMGSSIRRGMKEMDGVDAVVLMLCDQPFVTAALLRRIVALYKKGAALVACDYGGTFGPPTLFDRRYFEELKALEPDAGAKAVLMRHTDEMKCVHFPKGAIDIDTEEDLAEMSAARVK